MVTMIKNSGASAANLESFTKLFDKVGILRSECILYDSLKHLEVMPKLMLTDFKNCPEIEAIRTINWLIMEAEDQETRQILGQCLDSILSPNKELNEDHTRAVQLFSEVVTHFIKYAMYAENDLNF